MAPRRVHDHNTIRGSSFHRLERRYDEHGELNDNRGHTNERKHTIIIMSIILLLWMRGK